MLQVRHVTITVDRPWQDVYATVWRPERFPAWASGLAKADLRQDGGTWVATGPEGSVRIAFTAYNDFGVMDHNVHLASGHDVAVPMRVIANGSGAEIVLTLFRQPGMTEETFARDIAWVERDLGTLKRMLETGELGDKQPQSAQRASE